MGFKWKPSKAKIEAFKKQMQEQDRELDNLLNNYISVLDYAKWNENKSSLYLYFNDKTAWRISTHHLPNWENEGYRKYNGSINYDWSEKITNSRSNILKYATQLCVEKDVK